MHKDKKRSTKKHYSKVLKERIAELERDLYKILDGDIETITIYKAKNRFFQDHEFAMWSGNINDKKGFNGFISNIFKND